MRGGTYWNDADRCRSAYRNDNDPGNADDNLGFRLVRPAPSALGPAQGRLRPARRFRPGRVARPFS